MNSDKDTEFNQNYDKYLETLKKIDILQELLYNPHNLCYTSNSLENDKIKLEKIVKKTEIDDFNEINQMYKEQLNLVNYHLNIDAKCKNRESIIKNKIEKLRIIEKDAWSKCRAYAIDNFKKHYFQKNQDHYVKCRNESKIGDWRKSGSQYTSWNERISYDKLLNLIDNNYFSVRIEKQFTNAYKLILIYNTEYNDLTLDHIFYTGEPQSDFKQFIDKSLHDK